MKLLIDCADIEKIKKMYTFYPLSGVTCNPTILKRAGRKPYAALADIRAFIGSQADLHVQVVSATANEMIKEADYVLKRLGKNTIIKIPVDNNGLIAIRQLHEAGVRVTATAIYNPLQAYLAGLAGADFVAPYINRIDKISGNGIAVAGQIEAIMRTNGFNCKVLGASFHTTEQVLGMVEHGIYAATISFDLLSTLLISADVDKAIKDFRSDFEDLCGPDKTMMDCDGKI